MLIFGTLLLALALFGLSRRGSYTNITKQPDYLDGLMVGEIPENFAKEDCKNRKDSLSQANLILRVRAEEPLETMFGVCRQKVHVEQVFQGDGLKTDDEIYLISSRWLLNISPVYAEKSVERGFVNVLRVGYEYLVFCGEQVDTLTGETNIYRLSGDGESLVVPVFCYDDIDNTIVATSGESTYVPYSEVKNNEFFACTEGALKAIEELKREMLNEYPKSDQ